MSVLVADGGMVVESDLEDFTALYRRSYRTIFKYIHLRVNDQALAEDLTAEAFARAFEKQTAGVTISVGWLIRTARNLVGNEYQRRGREQARLQRMVAEELIAAPMTDDNEEAIQVRAAMSRLRPADALVLQLTYWDELSASEVAAFMECSTGAVWVRLSRARATMRTLLADSSYAGVASPLVGRGDLDG